jgi:hypothetical protein
MPARKAASEGKDEVSADAVSSDAKTSSIDCELATRKVARRVVRLARSAVGTEENRGKPKRDLVQFDKYRGNSKVCHVPSANTLKGTVVLPPGKKKKGPLPSLAAGPIDAITLGGAVSMRWITR